MSREQVVVVFIDRQVIEALAGRPWELELRNLSQCRMSYRRLSPDMTVPGPHANRHRGNHRHDKDWPRRSPSPHAAFKPRASCNHRPHRVSTSEARAGLREVRRTGATVTS